MYKLTIPSRERLGLREGGREEGKENGEEEVKKTYTFNVNSRVSNSTIKKFLLDFNVQHAYSNILILPIGRDSLVELERGFVAISLHSANSCKNAI